MKKNFYFIVFVLNFTTMAIAADVAADAAGKGGNTVGQVPAYCTNGSPESTLKDDSDYGGSKGFRSCNELAAGNLKKIYEGDFDSATFQWEEAITVGIKKCSNICDQLRALPISQTTPETIERRNQLANQLSKCVDEKKKKVPNCLAALTIMKQYGKDYKIEDHTKPVSPNTQSQPAVINQNSQSKNNPQAGISVTQGDNYGCKNESIETVDYLPCKKFSDYAQGLEVASQAVNVGQNLYYQNKAMDTGLEASKNMANDATAGLKAQKTNFKDQQAYFTQNSAIEATKAATLASIRAEMPNRDEVLDACKQGIGSKFKAPDGLNLTAQNCENVLTPVDNSSAFNLLANQQAKEKMTQKLVQLGVNAVAEGTKAYFAGKRADQVDGAIAAVDKFQPTTTPGLEQAVETTFCTMNPTAAKCIGSGQSAFSTIGDNIVDFGGNGTGTVYAGGTPDSGTPGGTASSGGTNGSKSTGVVGSAITSVNKGSGIEAPVNPATLQQKSASAGGGGGGGGGGSAGGGGGGGGGPLPSQGQQGGVTAAVTGKTLGYNAGSGISMLGGKGVASKKADTGANPFGNMFDKNKANDKLVNLGGRSPASVGTKGDNIFDMIHNRYNWANDKKLMLEYEEASK